MVIFCGISSQQVILFQFRKDLCIGCSQTSDPVFLFPPLYLTPQTFPVLPYLTSNYCLYPLPFFTATGQLPSDYF